MGGARGAGMGETRAFDEATGSRLEGESRNESQSDGEPEGRGGDECELRLREGGCEASTNAV